MKAKTWLRILFYSGALALIIYNTWDRIWFAKGVLEARYNILTHRKIVCTFGPALKGPNWKVSWNGEMWDDTTWVADSLLFTKFGYVARECKTDKNPGYFQEEAGQIYKPYSISYTRGYRSIYNPYLTKEILPIAIAEAKSLLTARAPNWKDSLPDEERRIRLLRSSSN